MTGAVSKPQTIEQKCLGVLLKNVSTVPLSTKGVVCVNSDSSIADAIHTLEKHDISSAPVRATDCGDWLGFVDMLDVLWWVHRVHSKNTTMVTTAGNTEVRHGIHSMHTMALATATPVEKIMNISKQDKFCPINHSANLFQVMETLASGVRRLPVFDDQNKVVTVVTQSAIIAYLHKNKGLLGSLLDRTLAELDHSGHHNVITVSADADALMGFELLNWNKVAAVAVMRGDQIVANLSARDLRGLTTERFPDLLLPTEQFLERNAKLAIARRPPGALPAPGVSVLTVRPDATLGEVLDLMAVRAVHRVWIVDAKGSPTGVVSMTDFLRHAVGAAAQ